MTTPDRPVGGSAGPDDSATYDDGVVRVYPGAPPATPETVAPVPPIAGAYGNEPPTRPTPFPATAPPSGPPSGPPSTTDEAKSAAGDVKDQAASSASDVKDTAAAQASQVTDTAREQATQVKDTAANAAADVAGTAREQASNVIGEASQQARQIADSLGTQLTEQASTQQQRAAGSIRSLAEGVSDMAEGRGAPSGPLGDYTRQAADRLQTAASYLESKQPGDLVDDVRSFAARRPTAFLLGAAVAGFAVGRLVKGAKGGSSSGSSSASGSSASSTATSGSGAGAYSAPSAPAPVVPSGLGDVPVRDDGFGTPTVDPTTPTPPPGYSSRIPVEPIPVEPIEEPYPTDGLYGDPQPLRDPLGDELPRDLRPGGGRSV
jgi:hypothetical protein